MKFIKILEESEVRKGIKRTLTGLALIEGKTKMVNLMLWCNQPFSLYLVREPNVKEKDFSEYKIWDNSRGVYLSKNRIESLKDSIEFNVKVLSKNKKDE